MDLLDRPPESAEYLGEGVWAWPDPAGGRIWLSTERRGGWHHIALDRETYTALLEFARTVFITRV